MNINMNTLLNTLITKSNPILKEQIEKLSVDGKIDLSSTIKNKGIQVLLRELFKDIFVGTKNKSEVLNLLEDNKHSLKFKNIAKDIKNIIKILSQDIENMPKIKELIGLLKNTLIDIKTIDEKVVKSTFGNSGTFLESKLLMNNASNMKNITGDLKTIILQIKEVIDKQNSNESVSRELKNNVDKVLSQIDYYQLSSYSSNSNHSYLSFLQDDLEDVDIKFNNSKDNEFSCLIHLSLKEKGDLKILLQLDGKKGLHINIGVEQENFKKKIQAELQALRVKINSLGLAIMSLNIFDLSDELKKSNELKSYENNQNLNFGVDIKV